MYRPMRFLLPAAIAIAGAFTSHAQLRYGFRFGGDIADARLEDAGAYTLKNGGGFSGGLVLEYQFASCGFAPDIAVLYARHNTRLRPEAGNASSFGRNYIDVPLHLKYKFWLKSVSETMAPMIYTGPALSLRLDHDGATPLTSKRAQFGWDVGIGFDIINFIQFSGGYRFALGNGAERFTGYPDAVFRNSCWNISATLLFDF